MSEAERLVEVYQCSGDLKAQIIKSWLESRSIPCILKSHAAPSVHIFTVNGMGEVKILVPEPMAKDAMKTELFHDKLVSNTGVFTMRVSRWQE